MAWWYTTTSSNATATSTTAPSTIYWSDQTCDWLDQTDNGTAGTTSTTYWPVWQNTITGGTGGTASSTSSILNATTNGGIYWPRWHETIVAPAVIRERNEAETARQKQQERQRAEVREKAKQATERAKQILFEHLTPQQRETVEKNGWFVIEGGKSGKLYRIHAGAIAGNVEELDEKGKVAAKYCCHLPHLYPAHDHHLAQKLMLEWDEQDFLRLANKRAA